MEDTRLWISLLLLLLRLPISAGDTYSSFNHRKVSLFRSTTTATCSRSTYAVIFDAGSSGSRVHVFHFNCDLDLLLIGTQFEVSKRTQPGLSSYADHPEKAAESLIPLLDEAERAVPPEFHPATPIILGVGVGEKEIQKFVLID